MSYYKEIPDDALDRYYSKNTSYINPYSGFESYNDEFSYDEDEYDYFQESYDDDLRKGVTSWK